MSFFRRFFFHSWKPYLTGLLLAAALVLWILYQKGFDRLLCYVEALTTAGAVVLLIGLLQLVAYLGAFDTFGYGWKYITKYGQYKDLVEYNEKQREKRAQGELVFMPFITVGCLILAAGLLLRLAL